MFLGFAVYNKICFLLLELDQFFLVLGPLVEVRNPCSNSFVPFLLSIYIFKNFFFFWLICWCSANIFIFCVLQKRNMKTNIFLICYPALLCILIAVLQHYYNKMVHNETAKQCDPKTNSSCPIPQIPAFPPLLQLPYYSAVRTDFLPFNDLPDESCRRNRSCPATILLTGNNQTLGESIPFSLPQCVCVCTRVLININN